MAQVPPRTFAARSLLGLLKAYKLLLSPLFSGSCRFHPSCADYSAEAIRTHGATRGVVLTLTRLSKCHPFGRHGFDPVPPRPAYDYDAGRAQCLANRLNAGPRDQVL